MVIELLLEKWFSARMPVKRIEKYCKRLVGNGEKRVMGKAEKAVKVSCVQRRITPVNCIERYIDIIYGFVKQATDENSELIVFPEYNFFDLFGLMPGFEILDKRLNKNASKPKQRKANSDREGSLSYLYAVFSGVATPVERTVMKIASLLAKGFGVYIYTGSYVLKENGAIYNAGSLFGPDGKCIGIQKKIHLTDFEAEIGMSRGMDIKVFPLAGTKVSLPICMDATYFETFAISRDMGADMVILPIANMEEYKLWKSLRGIWPRVQEAYVYGLKASLNGWIAGMHFTGKAGIFAPISITQGKDGVMAVSPHFEGNYLVTAAIDIDRLHEERMNAEYHGDRNPEFEKQYIDKTYFYKRRKI